MSDTNVFNAQVYLNAMFGGHPDWVAVTEDGITGTATMQAIVRAFQINNNVGSVTGTIGPLTIAKMQSLATISKMNPNDPSSINVCLIQCALFCKGYNAGGITGIYYNAGVAAINEYQNDAGITQTGVIDWKVWLGLLSLNWFKLAISGNSVVRTIQRQLNGDYSNIIGILPCDGVVSRQTVLALIGALQAEEGVTTSLITDLNQVNFGVATTANFPSALKINQNSSAYIGYNKIAQYGLFFNDYDPGNLDGIFDSMMQSKVSSFQEFYGLKNIGLVTDGEINVSVMKSLLTSKGDTDRISRACDCATILNSAQAQSLVNAGYTHVGRYLTGYVGAATRKYMTFDEITIIQNNGLNVFPIYQDGGYTLEYFLDINQGVNDAYLAINAAQRIGIPSFSTIYFAVDFDCYKYQVDDYIVPYFQNINTVFSSDVNTKYYKVGVYGPRYVCQKMDYLNLADYSFVADMSTGFSCNLGYKLPDNWSFNQFYEFQFSSSPSFPLDKVAYSGRDIGVSIFDVVETLTPQEIEEDNYSVIIENTKRDYLLNAMNVFNHRDDFVAGRLTYGVERTVAIYEFANVSLEFKVRLENEFTEQSSYNNSIVLSLDGNGNISTSCESSIMEVEAIVGNIDSDLSDSVGETLRGLTLSLKQGNIYL